MIEAMKIMIIIYTVVPAEDCSPTSNGAEDAAWGTTASGRIGTAGSRRVTGLRSAPGRMWLS